MKFNLNLKQRLKADPDGHVPRERRNTPVDDSPPQRSPRDRRNKVSASFRRTEKIPEKEGWMEYRVLGKKWHRDYFRIHGHYLSYTRDDNQDLLGGSIDLWMVQDMVLDNNELRLTLNSKALWRHGMRGMLSKTTKPVVQLRAASVDDAREWLEGMRRAALRSDSPANSDVGGESDIPLSPLGSQGDWNIRHIQLQRLDGSEIHTVKSLAGNASRVKMLLGSGLPETEMLQAQVSVEDPSRRPVTGCTSFQLDGGQGDLLIPLVAPWGSPLKVRLRWVAEPAAGGDDDTVFMQKGGAVAAASLVAFLMSAFLFLVVAGAGGYWLYLQSTRGAVLDCFLTYAAVESGDSGSLTPRTPRSRRGPLSPRSCTAPTSSPPSGDQSITAHEMQRVLELREALQDLKAPSSGVSAAVFEKHVNVDYRLVRFVRARPTTAQAADMVRESLRWRTETGADEILRTWRPPAWMLEYGGCPDFLEAIEKGTDRLPCYQRDKLGHLACYWRGGFVDFKNFWIAVKEDMALMSKVFLWIFELLREDMDKLHEQTNGAAPSYLTFIYDLEGFEYANQMPVQSLMAVAQQMFHTMNVNYPELVHRILIIRAPWLFSSLWSVFKPMIPKDLLTKMPLTGGGDVKKTVQNITPTMALDQIPKFLGGTMVDRTGDPECRQSIGPQGPFMPDKGKSFFHAAASQPTNL